MRKPLPAEQLSMRGVDAATLLLLICLGRWAAWRGGEKYETSDSKVEIPLIHTRLEFTLTQDVEI
jgi:hypothetical protein